ncbi:MAG: alpha-D-ribose 1-methylphosphonate 5-triphosphate diphosphatase, partial [Rhodobacteraceae bacterium]|nr:alpha-D-ribose 1-methylphosphonate 5-triphosphate diphosphatase [Paracoccaceae bacterium]
MNRLLTKNKDFILTNAKLVLADEVMKGTVVVKNGVIVGIDQGNSALSQAIDCDGSYVSAGLVELHTDNLERHLEPRPGVNWPIKTAVIAH